MQKRYSLTYTLSDGSELTHRKTFRSLKSVTAVAARAMKSNLIDTVSYKVTLL